MPLLQDRKISGQSDDSTEKPVVQGEFVIINTWTLANQITSLVEYKCMGSQYLLVSQPGGTFVNLTSQVGIFFQETNNSRSWLCSFAIYCADILHSMENVLNLFYMFF